MKKTVFIIISVTFVIIFLGLFLWFSQVNRPLPTTPQLVLPTAIPIPSIEIQAAPKSTLLIPTIQPGVVDLMAPEVIRSTIGIQKLSANLPYSTSFTTLTGIPVEIYISNTNLQGRNWTLPVSINGINYHALTATDPEYSIQKQAFREAANKVFDFLTNQGVNPNSIFITWGDKAYMQEAAETWLKN